MSHQLNPVVKNCTALLGLLGGALLLQLVVERIAGIGSGHVVSVPRSLKLDNNHTPQRETN